MPVDRLPRLGVGETADFTWTPSESGVYELHIAWNGEDSAEGELTVSLGRDLVRVPVARYAGNRGRERPPRPRSTTHAAC